MNQLQSILRKLLIIQNSISGINEYQLSGYLARHRLREDKKIVRSSIEHIQDIMLQNQNTQKHIDNHWIEFIEDYVSYFEGLFVNKK